MAQPARKPATYDALERIPEGVHAEVIGGEVFTFPGGLPRHGRSVAALGFLVGGPFDYDPQGPGGWWIIAEVDVELSPHDIVRPDLSGWRRARVPVFPQELPIRIVPDWICESTSPSNARHDRLTKSDLYARHGVPFYWIVDTGARMLEAFELQPGGGWLRTGAWGDGDLARIRPFDAVELDVGRLFPPPLEGELPKPTTVSEVLAAYEAGAL